MVRRTKKCSKCLEDKDLEDFHPNPGGKHGVRGQCKVCRNKITREYYRKLGVPERQKYFESQRDWHLQKRYGISQSDVDTLEEKQGGACAACGEIPPPDRMPQNRLHVDHCHETGKIRGLLCPACNKALGLAKDDISVLENLINYLKSGEKYGYSKWCCEEFQFQELEG